MRATMPPADGIERLAPEWAAISIHEAGHAVAGVLIGLPVYEVWLRYERGGAWLGTSWVVNGNTEVAPDRGTVDGTLEQEILFVAAGLEAEAMWRATANRCSLRAARRLVNGNRVNRSGDLQVLDACFREPDAPFTRKQAGERVHELLVANWSAVEQVAEQLRTFGRLAGGDIQRLVR